MGFGAEDATEIRRAGGGEEQHGDADEQRPGDERRGVGVHGADVQRSPAQPLHFIQVQSVPQQREQDERCRHAGCVYRHEECAVERIGSGDGDGEDRAEERPGAETG